MSIETALVTLTAIVAAALVLQVAAFWGIHRSIRAISTRLESLSSNVERRIGPLTERAQELLVTARAAGEQFQALQRDFAATTGIIHRRVAALDTFLAETTDSARLQVARVEDLIDTTSARMEETVERVQRGVVAPLNEIAALLRGVRVGFNFFFRGRSAQQAHQDEEMFI